MYLLNALALFYALKCTAIKCGNVHIVTYASLCEKFEKYITNMSKIILLENMFYMRENHACNIVPKYMPAL